MTLADFSTKNNLSKINYENLITEIKFDKFVNTFDYLRQDGNENSFFLNKTTYNFDNSNNISFSTRENLKTDLTEFYDLVYQYKNDCLTAGIKYKKTYYSDGDLRPTQNLLFTVTLFPLTTYEYDADDLLKDEDSFLNNLELSTEAFK